MPRLSLISEGDPAIATCRVFCYTGSEFEKVTRAGLQAAPPSSIIII